MPQNLSQKLISFSFCRWCDEGTPITLKIEQTLTQDGTGTLALLSPEAIGLDRVAAEPNVGRVGHGIAPG
jgi:aconitate hydratase